MRIDHPDASQVTTDTTATATTTDSPNFLDTVEMLDGLQERYPDTGSGVFEIEEDDECCIEEYEDDDAENGGGGRGGGGGGGSIFESTLTSVSLDILHDNDDNDDDIFSGKTSNNTTNGNGNGNGNPFSERDGVLKEKKMSFTTKEGTSTISSKLSNIVTSIKTGFQKKKKDDSSSGYDYDENLYDPTTSSSFSSTSSFVANIAARVSTIGTTIKMLYQGLALSSSSVVRTQSVMSNRRRVYCNIVAAIILFAIIGISFKVASDKNLSTPTTSIFANNDNDNDNDTNTNDDAHPAAAVNDSSSSRLDMVIYILANNDVSSSTALEQAGTAERYAAEFIADGDTYRIDYELEYPRFVERYVLAVLYYATTGKTKEEQWTNDYHFLSGKDHCDWFEFKETVSGTFRKGVECSTTETIGTTTTNRVIGLDLSRNNLVGRTIPSELAHLSSLQKLHLHHNTFGGNLPNLSKLTHLMSLGLMETELVGTLPDWLGDMTQLTTFAVSKNKFYDTIPVSFQQLQNLRILGLDGMVLEGTLDPIKGLASLEHLYLNDNYQLTGTLDHNGTTTMWNNMIELDISNNMLSGSVPSTILQSPSLKVLDLHKNLFTGNFPQDILPNDALHYLALHENRMTGTISDRIGYLTNLKHLDLSSNELSGTVPDTLVELSNLVSLSTSVNKFDESTIKDYYSKMTSLQELSMKANNYTAGIPGFLEGMTHLQILDLDSNQLDGTIPSWIGLLTNLKALLLNRNELHGTIPSDLARLQRLEVLLLDGNNLYGNTNAICVSPHGMDIVHFITDCYPKRNDEDPEVMCRCCTLCCADHDPDCNNAKWTINGDIITNYGDTRRDYNYNVDQAPDGWWGKFYDEAVHPSSSDGGASSSF